MIVAIDGPAGAGKSSVGKAVAQQLGFVRIDTGALYRAVGFAATRGQVGPEDPGLGAFASGLDLAFDGDRVLLDGEDVTEAIRTPEMSKAASLYAAKIPVREALLSLQRRLGRAQDSVLEGRDIGTVVFPDAEVKIFLTASDEARAQRRLKELEGKGITASLDEVLADIRARDAADSGRDVAPLVQADDAVVVDTTALDFEGAVEACVRVVKNRQ
ncbi:MAG: (d)CMP kinase [Bradymonadia bacterium]